jgi:hypothetical protein
MSYQDLLTVDGLDLDVSALQMLPTVEPLPETFNEGGMAICENFFSCLLSRCWITL